MGKYFVDGLTKRQIETFEQIAIGNDSCVNPKIADKLLQKGLIEKFFQEIGNMIIYRYSVPIPIHIQWCNWCYENVKDES